MRIAVDVLLPKALPAGSRVPAVLVQTRYWRAMELRPPFSWFLKMATNPAYVRFLVEHGFAVVETDVRGTGASEGTRPYPVSEQEVRDGADVVDWIVQQEWSDGRVLTWGNSYTGITSELALSLGHPAVKGGVVMHDPWDFYEDVIFPGGAYNRGFTQLWSDLGKGLDSTRGEGLRAFAPVKPLFAKLVPKVVRGVKPVGGDRTDLARVAKIHEGNSYPENYSDAVTFRDDAAEVAGANAGGATSPASPASATGLRTIDDISVAARAAGIRASGVPMFSWGSWQDSSTAEVVVRRFLNYDNPHVAVVGDWDHQNKFRASPFFGPKAKSQISRDGKVAAWAAFYRQVLDGNFPTDLRALFYYTMGEERWKKTTTWPPLGTTAVPWYLSPGRTLSKAPLGPGSSGEDRYRVDFSATTGKRNRWYTLLSLPVHYPDREKMDQRLLTYESDPLGKPMEITGHPVAVLHLATDRDDGMVQVILELVDPSGRVHYLTDGQLRFLHRKVRDDPPYRVPRPYHSFRREDALEVVPGEFMELVVPLHPTSVVVPAGWRLRLASAGADADTFARYPREGDATFTVARDEDRPSRLELPTRKRGV
ncbi:MAG: CocE/NonD family hydrolase [Promethearchaeota archaeon]